MSTAMNQSAVQNQPEADFERPAKPAESPGFLLWRVTLSWQRSIAAALKPHDLTHVQFVLLAGAGWLGAQEGPPTQRHLADHSGTDPMMTSQVLRTLESKGLVERIPDLVDTRAKRVQVTEAGATLLEKAMYAVEKADSEFFAPVPRNAALAVLYALSDEWGQPLASGLPSNRKED
ncbi:MarR family winged helix-turn-helix transcriptional regulator [Kitasatospora sp. NPDC101155]|uniref:MarR family winged helix-turn-helix transcriptional regulator n=1 Tax=Kitasatospora sp. NPDC101155 TaxID=3364097 RepID=UPI00380D00B3